MIRLDEKAERFQKLLAGRRLKFTFERQSIFKEVTHLKRHFDADSLYERFKQKGTRISRDTVYRTIPLLLESGIIQKSVGEGKCEFYELVTDKGHHDHMVCVRCSKFIEFQCEEIEVLQDKVAGQYGFQLIFHDHRLFGICADCQKLPLEVPAESNQAFG